MFFSLALLSVDGRRIERSIALANNPLMALPVSFCRMPLLSISSISCSGSVALVKYCLSAAHR
ncbi:hypothetical protein D3C87_1049570 [compost metagenome]